MIYFVTKGVTAMGPFSYDPERTTNHDPFKLWRDGGYDIVVLEAPALEERKVAALERIADALERNGETMPVQRPQMFTGQAPVAPKLEEPAKPAASVVEEDSDEVEPMNGAS